MPANPKPERVIDKVRRHIQRRDTTAAEQAVMRQVRREDRYCRFPLCGCGRMKLALDVAHAGADGHRGMGGNRSLSKTTPENLILLCRPRHKAHKFSVDKKTLRVEALTDAGLRGPVRWLVSLATLPLDLRTALFEALADTSVDIVFTGVRGGYDGMVVIAVERAPHAYEPFTVAGREILQFLSSMEH